jgi:amino acid transporter
MGGNALATIAQFLSMTSLFAALLAFHNAVWRYTFAISRERVLPAFLSQTGANSIPKAASLAQSLTGLAVIAIYAVGGWAPMTDLFFWLGTTGGFGILVLLALTSVAVIRFFGAGPGTRTGETAWARLTAPALSAVSLAVIAVLAVLHYATLLGVTPGSPAAWLLPASFAAAAAIGLCWAGFLRSRRPDIYATIGLGAAAITGESAPVPGAYR